LQHKISRPVNARAPRRRLIWLSVVALVSLGVTALILRAVADDLIERRLRPAMIRLLEQRFNSQVELASLNVRVFPALAIRGEGLVLRHRARTDIPPLITVRAFSIESSVRALWARRLDRVRLEGLQIVIPPRRGADMPTLPADAPSTARERDRDNEENAVIHEVVAEDGLLSIMSKNPAKPPREFRLTHLRFEELQFDTPVTFAAELSNPVPQGVIHTVGSFGPWNGGEPALTVIDGTFRFDADLGTIKGISGDLHAEGTFNGALERIETEGRTQTPDFRLSSGGTAFPLLVHYKAIVDGTSGDTLLDSVEADLASSHISARGAVVRADGVKGRRVTLDTRTHNGRIEDFIRLATEVETSPLVGDVDVTAALDIPPGPEEVIERMHLAGKFELASARFTSAAIQDQVDTLSRTGRGRPKDAAVDDVASNMRGSFDLRDGALALRSLRFSVEGAEVRLAGNYGVRSGRLNFAGQLRLRASASQTQTGWKSLVLKPFDPLLRRDGAGTVLAIKIGGTREKPEFGVDMKKSLLRRD
jgi:hypothetical protein